MFPIDLRHTPFTRRASHLQIVHRADGRLGLMTVRKKAASDKTMPAPQWAHDLFLLELDGEPFPRHHAVPGLLTLIGSGGQVRFTWIDGHTLLIEGSGAALKLTPMQSLVWAAPPIGNQDDHIGAFAHANLQYRLRLEHNTPLRHGLIDSDARGTNHPDWIVGGTPRWKAALRLTDPLDDWTQPLPDFDQTLADHDAELAAWMNCCPPVADTDRDTARRAWFMFWNLEVPMELSYHRRAILSTKDYLNQIWGWDNCFHALALGNGNLDLAWQQMLLFFDRISPTGQLPDCINESGSNFTYLKPPLYGWTISKLIRRHGLQRNLKYVREIYEPLTQATMWWYRFRDPTGRMMPCYLNGNDSGWDNSTAFDQGFPTAGADLAAYLVLQQSCLATLADALGRPQESQHWQQRADQQLQSLLQNYVVDDRFVSPLLTTGHSTPNGSLINCIPLILGRRLPQPIIDNIVADLRSGGRFLSPFGLASEALDSPKFAEDGYWRGPVWAPPNLLLIDALIEVGQTELATTIARRFCDTANASPGLWEHYSALTGAGLRAPNTLWTAAVVLELARQLANSAADDAP